jgi:hypothetical protein
VVQVEVSYGSDVQLNRTAIASAGGGRPQALGGSNPSLSARLLDRLSRYSGLNRSSVMAVKFTIHIT